jgi:hypothetical protein
MGEGRVTHSQNANFFVNGRNLKIFSKNLRAEFRKVFGDTLPPPQKKNGKGGGNLLKNIKKILRQNTTLWEEYFSSPLKKSPSPLGCPSHRQTSFFFI